MLGKLLAKLVTLPVEAGKAVVDTVVELPENLMDEFEEFMDEIDKAIEKTPEDRE